MTPVYTQTPNIAWLMQAIDNMAATVPAYAGIVAPDGLVYLIHLHAPLGRQQTAEQRARYQLPPRQSQTYIPTAQHYLGWTNDLAARWQSHSLGHGSRFLAAAHRENIPFEIVRVWPGGREFERRLKNRKNTPRLCPLCQPVQRSLFELTPAQIASALIPF